MRQQALKCKMLPQKQTFNLILVECIIKLEKVSEMTIIAS